MLRMSSVFDPLPPARIGLPVIGRSHLGPGAWRALLLAGCTIAALGAYALGDPAALQAADPDLAVLLRGMASIKAALVAAGLGVLWWRFRWPVSTGVAAGYLAGAWLATGAAMMIWQLTLIAGAAVMFHLGELTLLGLAWWDHRRVAVID